MTDNPKRTWGERGERNAQSKLTVDDVRAIKRALADGATVTDLAVSFGVAHSTISAIKHKRTWREVRIEEDEK